MKSIVECKKGKFIIDRVFAGINATRRLAALGILPGIEIEKIQSATFFGPIIVSVKRSSLIIGRGLASKIMIKEIE